MRLYSRPGNDLTRQFPLIAETLARLRSRSCIIDGEAVACDETGIARFEVCSGQLSGLCGRLFWRAVEPLNLGRNLVPPGGQVREFSFEVWVSDF
jgi:hypothetical protein